MAEPKGYLVVPVGFNPSGDIRALELDADDAVLMAIKSAAKGLVGPHGWIDGAWQKNPLLLGYSGPIGDQINENNAAAGFDALLASAVPAGEIWVVTSVSGRDVTTAITKIIIYFTRGTDSFFVAGVQSPAKDQFLTWSGQIVLIPGDELKVGFWGTVAGDDIEMTYSGYRVDIDQ